MGSCGEFEVTYVYITTDEYAAVAGWTTDGPEELLLTHGAGDFAQFQADLPKLLETKFDFRLSELGIWMPVWTHPTPVNAAQAA